MTRGARIVSSLPIGLTNRLAAGLPPHRAPTLIGESHDNNARVL